MTDHVIILSFKVCKISSNMNGSDEGFIHCLKPDEVAHSAFKTIAALTLRLNSRDGAIPFPATLRRSLRQT